MRFSLASVLCGAIAASALSVPRDIEMPDFSLGLRADSPKFQMVPPEDAKAKVAEANKNNKGNSTADAAAGAAIAAAGTCSNLRIRTEWRLLSSTEKSNFVNAIKCLVNKPSGGNYPGSRNRYEDLVWVHQQMVNTIHMVGQFLPWHRYYLHIFEDMLRSECGLTTTFPWWDETQDAGNFHNSPVFASTWFGVGPLRRSDRQPTCMVNTGVFKGMRCHVGPGSSFVDRCLSRAIDESLTAQCNAAYVRTCRNAGSYADFETCTEYGPHAYGHNGIGADGAIMSDVATSPGDPIFFMHHSFVDHSWRIWQNDVYPGRLSAIGGPTTQGGNTQLTLDYTLSSRGLRPAVKVRDVMDTTGTYLCYKYNI